MLDFEEFSFGHRDPTSHKYYSSLNECPSPTMDMLLSANDSLSFQEMLDVDIKSEIETVLSGHTDFNPFSFSDIPPLELDEPQSDLNMWFSNNSNHSSSNFNIDFIGSEGAALMVNPNSVMPLTLVTVPKKETLIDEKREARVVKKDKVFSLDKKPIGKTIKMITPTLGKPILKPNLSENKSNSVLNIKNSLQRQISSQNIRVLSSQNRKNQFNRFNPSSDDKIYPKPAYSYSCLIAMALKNSRTGSLPVSEIYNFMCEHFPYFKTAPTGWKNSVRHNLSLNKCFEKIEKPAMSGAQRKGCLWAMNPNKISKMDEEVQKWSRKDPTAIRKAMINPEHLEALERGELKYSYSSEDGYADSNGDTESEEASDVEVELENQAEEERNDDIDFVDVNHIEEDEEELGFDIEVADLYENNDTDTEQNLLQVEMALAEQELLEYEDKTSKKRSRSILEMDDDHRLFEVQNGRRKTAYVLMD